jgi:hypothetical protein
VYLSIYLVYLIYLIYLDARPPATFVSQRATHRDRARENNGRKRRTRDSTQKRKLERYSVFLLEYLKGKGHLENADEDGRIIFK